MAIGLGRMVGSKLPENFRSPYKARNIIEFWRRWHITLSRFLRDYIYIPLGGNRKGFTSRYINILITMFLGGLWHGASWTFVVWGTLHGLMIVINTAWNKIINNTQYTFRNSRSYSFSMLFVTFFSISITWIFFRAESFDGAFNLLQAVLGINGISLPERYLLQYPEISQILINTGIQFGELTTWPGRNLIFILLLITVAIFVTPNTQEIFKKYNPVIWDKEYVLASPTTVYAWRPDLKNAIAIIFLLLTALLFILVGHGERFIYFQF